MPIAGKKGLSGKQLETIIAIIIVLVIVGAGFLVHYKFILLNFFFLPVIFSGYYLGRRRALLIAITCILLETLYLVFSYEVVGVKFLLSQDDLFFLISWAVFLVLTAWIVGTLSERTEREVLNLKKAYLGILAIVLKYLEVGEEGKSRAEKIADLAGKMAEVLELNKAEVENIKSAALLSDIQDLQNFLPLFSQTSKLMNEEDFVQNNLSDREKILLKTAALILDEVQPILQTYFVHYRQKANELEKSLAVIPLGASLIALAELYIRLQQQGKVKIGPEEVSCLEDIRRLRGNYFPEKAIDALFLVAY
jgi:predicted MPP superfamily phosphohydrolase